MTRRPPPDPRRYLLELRDLWPDEGPVAHRLRRALKTLLRSFGLRCTRAEEHPVAPPGRLKDAFGPPGEALDPYAPEGTAEGHL